MPASYDKLIGALKSRLPDASVDALGRTVAFIRRLREIRASMFVWSVVMSRFGHGRPAFEQARQWYERLTGRSIWRRPFQIRFKSAGAVRLFERAFEQAVAPWRSRAGARGIRHALAKHVADIVVVDGSLIRVDDALRSVFKGTGKKGRTAGGAMLKVILSISAFGGLPVAAQLAAGAQYDSNFFPRLDLFAQGTLFLFDKGFFVHSRLKAIHDAGHHFLCAMKRSGNPLVVGAASAPQRVRAALKRQPQGVRLRELLPKTASITSNWDLDVVVDGLPCRLVIVPARDRKQRPYYTTLDRATFPPRAIAETYRLRWQVELVFKELKQHLNLAVIPTKDRFAAQVLVWASLIALVISRIVTAWLWPANDRVGLASNRRPAVTSRALRGLAVLLAEVFRPTSRFRKHGVALLGDAVLQQVESTRTTSRADTFGRLEKFLAEAA